MQEQQPSSASITTSTTSSHSLQIPHLTNNYTSNNIINNNNNNININVNVNNHNTNMNSSILNNNNYNLSNHELQNNNSLKVKIPKMTKMAREEANNDVIIKPYRCSVLGCEKTYKNSNGLKYHNIHGHRPSGPDDDGTRSAPKPYFCKIEGCDKRYKNPNGLKYHLEHAHNFSFANPSTLPSLRE
ncbi:1536_t:CDS:1, partial [Ambispora gerdemannii]